MYTLHEHASERAWPQGERALLREMKRSNFPVQTRPGSVVLARHMGEDANALTLDMDTGQRVTVVQIVKHPQKPIATIHIWFVQPPFEIVWYTSIEQLETTSQEASVVAALKFHEVYRAKLDKTKAPNTVASSALPQPSGRQSDSVSSDRNRGNGNQIQLMVGAIGNAYHSGAAPRFGPVMELGWKPGRRVLVSLQMAMGLWGKELYWGTLRGQFRHYDMRIHVDYQFRKRQIVQPFVGAFAGSSMCRTKGITSAELTATAEQAYSFNAGLRAGLVFLSSHNVALVTIFSIASFVPTIDIYFGETAIAMYGPLYSTVTIAVRIQF